MADSERTVFKIHINASKQDLWHELTKTDSVHKAMYDSMMHVTAMEPGGKYQMRTKNNKNVVVVGDILEFDPPNRLKKSFRFTQYDDPECTITYEIEDAKQGGVDFTLIIDDLPKGTKTAKGMTAGGDFICKNLKAIMETGKPTFGARCMYAMGPALAPLLFPKRTRLEHWPLEN